MPIGCKNHGRNAVQSRPNVSVKRVLVIIRIAPRRLGCKLAYCLKVCSANAITSWVASWEESTLFTSASEQDWRNVGWLPSDQKTTSE